MTTTTANTTDEKGFKETVKRFILRGLKQRKAHLVFCRRSALSAKLRARPGRRFKPGNHKMGKRNNAKTQNLIAVGIFAMLLFAGANQVGAATIYVSQNSPSPKPPFATWDTAAHTIQEAVDVGSDGDSVLVAEGEYRLSAQGASLPRQGTIIIERSTDLRMWQPIRTNAITGGAFELVEPISANRPPQFFLALITY